MTPARITIRSHGIGDGPETAARRTLQCPLLAQSGRSDLRAAKALGLTISPQLVARADEVIE
jgi:hypothetical protein